jgi:hypothetical protein
VTAQENMLFAKEVLAQMVKFLYSRNPGMLYMSYVVDKNGETHFAIDFYNRSFDDSAKATAQDWIESGAISSDILEKINEISCHLSKMTFELMKDVALNEPSRIIHEFFWFYKDKDSLEDILNGRA